LSDAGYVLALDDFAGEPEREALVDVVDILKIDFKLATDHAMRREMVERYTGRCKELLAEKVETREDEKHAKDLGYSLFQGFYYSEPRVQSRRDIPRLKQSYLLFLQQLRQPELDMPRIEALIRGEVSLSVRLLKYLNSCAFGLSRPISSIRQALVYLGEQPLRRWGSVVAIAGLGDDGPQELVVTTLVRARFCELLGEKVGMDPGEAFLVGLVSSLDALLGKPREEVLAEIGVDAEIMRALDGNQSNLGRLFAAVSAYERGNWDEVSDSLSSLRRDKDQAKTISALYCQAVEWARALVDEPGQSPAGTREVA
jgi:EAL and modified HD-GYP domain-containing signal transduction protein